MMTFKERQIQNVINMNCMSPQSICFSYHSLSLVAPGVKEGVDVGNAVRGSVVGCDIGFGVLGRRVGLGVVGCDVGFGVVGCDVGFGVNDTVKSLESQKYKAVQCTRTE